MNLEEIENRVNNALDIQLFNNWRLSVVSKYDIRGVSYWLATDQQSYYPQICTYAKLICCKHFLEIGTREGGLASLISSIALETTVLDIDYSHWNIHSNLPGLSKRQIRPDDCYNQNWLQYDCIFVDIDHSGYKGIVFWDDIGRPEYANMNDWWSRVTLPKINLSWHENGFGAIQY